MAASESPAGPDDRGRHEIVLIGPMGAGKSTLGRVVAQRLGVPQVAVDDVRWDYYEQIGYDYDHVASLSGEHGFEGVYRYWKRFELYAVERILAEHADCVVDFGAGHSVYEDDAFFERARRALAPFRSVVLLLPSPDLEESVRILRGRTGMPPADPGQLDFVEHFVRHHSNRDLATLTVYTGERTPEETADELLARIAVPPAWPAPGAERRRTAGERRATTLLHAATHASGFHRDHAAAALALDEALAIRRALGAGAEDLAEVLRAQAAVDVALGRATDAHHRLAEALALYDAAPRPAPPEPVRDNAAPPTAAAPNRSPTGYARTLDGLARLERVAGAWGAARGWAERAVEAWRPFGQARTATALGVLSEVAREQGDGAGALQAYEEALAIARARADRPAIVSTQQLGGHLALTLGDLRAARTRYAEALAVLRLRGDRGAPAETLEAVALFAAADGRAAAAVTLAGAAATHTPDGGGDGGGSPAAATRALRARYLERAEQALSPEDGARARAAGAAMSLPDALDFAAACLESAAGGRDAER
jgi:shikimate kinase/tetratricopeptide (TPR) repeat protein